jgi:hypothetical protein
MLQSLARIGELPLSARLREPVGARGVNRRESCLGFAASVQSATR